jgi:ketosteroid isomerase-like protein
MLGTATLVFGMQPFGDKWTSERKVVWENQEAYFELWRKGDFDGLLAICHRDYAVWPYGRTSPVERHEHVGNIVSYARISAFVLTPVQINVVGNVASVYFIRRITLQEGRVYSDYAMCVWVKQDGKWLILGEMSASYKPMSIYLPRLKQNRS